MVDYTTKTLSGYLLADWQSGDLRFRKTKPDRSNSSPTEQPIKVEIEMKVPTFETPTLAAEVNVPESHIKRAAHDDILSVEDGDLPEWADIVADCLTTYVTADEIREGTGRPEEEMVDAIVGAVLRNADGYPDPAEVETFVFDVFADPELFDRVVG